MPFKPEDFPIFSPPDSATINIAINKIKLYLTDFSKNTKIADITIYDKMLFEIIERIEKRRVYFHIFYDGCEMGELNEISLLCFWILKLTPFFSPGVPTSTLNAKIAIHIFIKMLTFIKNTTGKQVNLTDQIIKDLHYAFCYRDVSKESIMLLAESLLYT
jgi:hypothetical protein